MTAFYNEIEPYAAAWLANLSAAGHIARGTVNTASITEITPDDVRHATQAHFFAGLGAWSYALRLAGWPDDVPVWTGSCPCQPFSVAGKRSGTDDARHLWPDWFRLIRECRPVVVFGEQVASRDGYVWLDAVHADLEGAGYTVGAAVLPAAGVGAPHGRHRIWFVAVAAGARLEGIGLGGDPRPRGEGAATKRGGADGDGVAIPASERQCRARDWKSGTRHGPAQRPAGGHGGARELADADEVGWRAGIGDADARGDELYDAGRCPTGGVDDTQGERHERDSGDGRQAWGGAQHAGRGDARTSPWSNCAWIPCRDGKARPVEPGTFPLAHGAPARVGRLRAYGNAIVPQVAARFIRAFLDTVNLGDVRAVLPPLLRGCA